MGHLLNNQLKWKLLYPLQYINRCQTDQENIKVSIEKCWWCSFRWIKLKAHLTNLFFFSKEKGENFFYVPIEHVIQQAFIGIFRINSWGRSKHFFYPFWIWLAGKWLQNTFYWDTFETFIIIKLLIKHIVWDQVYLFSIWRKKIDNRYLCILNDDFVG